MPFYGSWLNRIEAQLTPLRSFALDPSHREKASMTRRYIAWRNRHITDPRLRKVIRRGGRRHRPARGSARGSGDQCR